VKTGVAIHLTPGAHGLPREVVAAVQRERMLDAMAEVAAREGYAYTTVAKVVATAGVSRKTFYEQFANKEECFLAAYDQTIEHVLGIIAAEYGRPGILRTRVRRGLQAFLRFCAAEPARARLCIVEVLAAGPAALERRLMTVQRFARFVDTVREDVPGEAAAPSLAAEAAVGGITEILYSRLLDGQAEELPELTDAIMRSQLGLLTRRRSVRHAAQAGARALESPY
jgi:AcrR family transcriptional regulator